MRTLRDFVFPRERIVIVVFCFVLLEVPQESFLLGGIMEFIVRIVYDCSFLFESFCTSQEMFVHNPLTNWPDWGGGTEETIEIIPHDI